MTRSAEAREARVLEIVEGGMKLISEHYKDGAFCTGSAWTTMNLILVALGQPKQEAPWETKP